MSTRKIPRLRESFGKADAFDDFYPDDPAAFFGQIVAVLKKKYALGKCQTRD